MKRKKLLAVGAFSIVFILISSLTIYSNSNSVKTKDKLELAEKYLEDLNYEQAIAEYNVILDLSPKNEVAIKGIENACLEYTDRVLSEGEEVSVERLNGLLALLEENYQLTELASIQEKSSEIKRVIESQNVEVSKNSENSEIRDAGIEKDQLELGENLNIFLSKVYQGGIQEYNFNDYDIRNLMNFVYRFPVEGIENEGDAGNYYYLVPYENVNNILHTYFGITAPQGQIDDILYSDGQYYFPLLDYGELGMRVVIANNIEYLDGKYNVTFDAAYIWPEDFSTGIENPIEDWKLYYTYDSNQIKNDGFCEVTGYGNAVIEVKENNKVITEFHLIEGYQTPLAEEEAYNKVEKYWTSLGKNMPENVEFEGMTEYGYCFWGFYMNETHAATNFRIAVDANTGRLYDYIKDAYIN